MTLAQTLGADVLQARVGGGWANDHADRTDLALASSNIAIEGAVAEAVILLSGAVFGGLADAFVADRRDTLAGFTGFGQGTGIAVVAELAVFCENELAFPRRTLALGRGTVGIAGGWTGHDGRGVDLAVIDSLVAVQGAIAQVAIFLAGAVSRGKAAA